MRALHVPAAGQQPHLSDLPIPEVTEGTVLIRVKAAGLNAFDNAVAAGMLAEMMPHEYPLVLGRDAAGVVEAVGAGVDHVAVGDEVIGHVLMAPPIQAGTLAEYALVPRPASPPSRPGSTSSPPPRYPWPGPPRSPPSTAIDPQPGQIVLVNGASGGVGSYAIQLLTARGASVVATGTGAGHRAADRPWGAPRHRLHRGSGRRAGPRRLPRRRRRAHRPGQLHPGRAAAGRRAQGRQGGQQHGRRRRPDPRRVRPDRVQHHGRPGPRGRRTPGRAGRRRHAAGSRRRPCCRSSRPPRAWPPSPKARPAERSSSGSATDSVAVQAALGDVARANGYAPPLTCIIVTIRRPWSAQSQSGVCGARRGIPGRWCGARITRATGSVKMLVVVHWVQAIGRERSAVGVGLAVPVPHDRAAGA